MRAPAFWWRPPGLAAALLGPVAKVYGALAARTLDRPGSNAAVPVVCIGNVTVGGSGKTPTAIFAAALMYRIGRVPAFLTRGYGGRLAGPVLVDRTVHSARDVGDEALLLARHAATIVSRDRVAGAAAAAANGADLIVMDDGLQNPSLRKDVSLAVFDGAVGIGNGRTLPAGPLRAGLTVQWPLIGAVLVIGDGEPGRQVGQAALARGLPVFRGRLSPEPTLAASLEGRRVLAFAGIGRPAKFFDTVRSCGAEIVAERPFPDHHAYTLATARALLDQAARCDASLVTTEKDAARLAALIPAEPRLRDVAALPVELVIDEDPQAFETMLVRAVSRPRRL